MKRILIYFVVVLVIPALVAVSLLKVVTPRIVREKRLSALEYCDRNRDYNDMIFLGSSRVRQHIDPAAIDSITHLKSFNLSIDAAGAVECNLLLNKYLEYHRPPRYLFLNIDLHTFDVDVDQPYITEYFDYLNDSVTRRCLSPYKFAYRNKLIQDYYKFLKFFSTSDVDKNNVFFGGKISNDYKKRISPTGFFPHGYNWDKTTNLNKHLTYNYSERGINLVKSMVDKCRKDSIQVVFVFSPVYTPAKKIITDYNTIFNVITNLSKQLNVPFLDYSNMYISYSTDYFTSLLHLNYRGAEIFSRQLGNDIKNEFMDSTGRYYRPTVIRRKPD